MKFTRLHLIVLLTMGSTAYSQDFNKRYSFAKAYFGVDANFVPHYGLSPYSNSKNEVIDFERNAFVSPAINFAASHFWGYLDLFVSVNTAQIKIKKDAIGNAMSLGAATGLRLYPLPLNEGKLRPFLGYQFSPFLYAQRQQGTQIHTVAKTKSIVSSGLGYKTPKMYFYAAYNKVANPDFDLYINRTTKKQTNFPVSFFSLGINYSIETTRATNNPKSKKLHGLLDSANKAGFFVAIGPSSAFAVHKSPYITKVRPYLVNTPISGFVPDMGMGYHFTKQDAIVSMAFRSISQDRSAFEFKNQTHRKSLVLESYKFLFDYHGFAPFVGGGASYEDISVVESDNATQVTNIEEQKVTPIITFGWDIRPARKGDTWLLRTNLRYAPLLQTKIQNEKLSLQQLEFNFIQFVWYPSKTKFLSTH